MDRRASIVAAAVAALLSLGACQGYNFNPVGHCLIQPGTERVTLSKISTADILFVVDDSGSMLGEQTNLAAQFNQFITALDNSNAERVAYGLTPIDFHIAITTTSVFRSPRITGTSICRNTCTGATGANVCCVEATGTPQPPACRVDSDCDTAHGYGCRSTVDCGAASAVGGYGCFTVAPTCTPQRIPCTTLGEECGNIQEWYSTFSGCSPSYADNLFTAADEYPMGRFMALPGNPLVLHFDKDLYCAWNATTGQCTGPSTDTTTKPALITDFGENVVVGTCGSNQEQGIEAARDAIERARGLRGGQPTGPGYTGLGDFLHADSKLVVVWVTDEDDCSSPQNGADSVVFWQTASSDGCKADALLPAADQREFSASSVAAYFGSLGRPFAAAMVASFANGCNDLSCSIGYCCDTACTGTTACTSATCGGQGLPNRYKDLADALIGGGSQVVLGSVCDSFGGPGGTLERIAQIAQPPPGLTLPTLPAAGAVTILRITKADGTRRKSCYGPAPETMTAAEAAAAVPTPYDWWFTASDKQTTDADKHPTGVSRFVYINHLTNNCEANPGETYSADYLGLVPAGAYDKGGTWVEGGCIGATTVGDAMCANRLGGAASDWTCFAGYDASATPKCLSTATTRGTCVCGARTDTANPAASNCPGGSL
jgi:hypothetical protein